MSKGKQINILHTMTAAFVLFAPVVGCMPEKGPVIYLFLCAFAAYVGCRIFKDGYVVLTKTFLFQAAVGLWAFIQLFWVSDKGSQVQLGALFFLGAAASLLVGYYKVHIGKDKLYSLFTNLLYSSAFIYAAAAVLYQIFIESSFLGSNMDFGSGSSTMAACLMVIGVISAHRIFKGNKKQPLFLVSVLLMVYVFVMTKSLLGYTFCAALLFVHAMKQKQKKTEALAALVLTAVLGVANTVFAVAALVKNPEEFNSAIKGLVSIVGVGAGGYNASVSIVDKGYEGFSSVCCLFLEAFGIVGIAIVAIGALCFVNRYLKTRSFDHMILLLLFVAFMLSKSAAMAFMLPVISMLSAACDDAYRVDIHKAISLVTVVPVVFSALFCLAHVPYFIASSCYDSGNYAQSASWYGIGAKMELFNSHGWEKAYTAQEKEFESTGVGTDRVKFLENAVRYNKKNYMYLRQLADVYTSEGDHLSALEVWESIILRHDKEYLYPIYGEKIYNVMANCPVGLEQAEHLYNTLDTLAKKATDKDIVLEVNNILARSQQYYINAREGTAEVADMYMDTTETVEVEYESGNTEG